MARYATGSSETPLRSHEAPALAEALAEEVSRHPDGVGITALLAWRPGVPRRTLQRHLANLVAVSRLLAEGQASARVYRVAPTLLTPASSLAEAPWRSPAGLEVALRVGQPLVRRTPVGYRRRFLDAYRPNVDAYLPASLRAHLHTLGRSPDGERPAGTYARSILDRLLIVSDRRPTTWPPDDNSFSPLDVARVRAADGSSKAAARPHPSPGAC